MERLLLLHVTILVNQLERDLSELDLQHRVIIFVSHLVRLRHLLRMHRCQLLKYVRYHEPIVVSAQVLPVVAYVKMEINDVSMIVNAMD